MAEPTVEQLVEGAIEELNEAVPHLVSAEAKIKEFWTRVTVGMESNPTEVAGSMVQAVGGLLTWMENVKRGIGS